MGWRGGGGGGGREWVAVQYICVEVSVVRGKVKQRLGCQLLAHRSQATHGIMPSGTCKCGTCKCGTDIRKNN